MTKSYQIFYEKSSCMQHIGLNNNIAHGLNMTNYTFVKNRRRIKHERKEQQIFSLVNI